MVKYFEKTFTLILGKMIFMFVFVFVFFKAGKAQASSGPSFPITGLPDPPEGIAGILANLLSWLLGIVGIIALISFVISGLQYFLAAGDENSMQTAKKNMLYSIIGIVVALSGFIIVKAIDTALRGTGVF